MTIVRVRSAVERSAWCPWFAETVAKMVGSPLVGAVGLSLSQPATVIVAPASIARAGFNVNSRRVIESPITVLPQLAYASGGRRLEPEIVHRWCQRPRVASVRPVVPADRRIRYRAGARVGRTLCPCKSIEIFDLRTCRQQARSVWGGPLLGCQVGSIWFRHRGAGGRRRSPGSKLVD